MALSAAQHLELIDAVLQKRLAGDGYESYSEAEQRFHGVSIDRLYEIRTRLQQEVAMTTGGCFRLGEPFHV